jgi:predicted O-methyltransferase YrrM
LNSFTGKARSAGRFLDFVLHSGNRYRIHSPFLYSLIGEVVRKDRPVDGGEMIEQIRKECLESKETIRKTDYGKSSLERSSVTYDISIKDIASASLTSPRHARRLSRLARYMKAERILEIGTSLGITSAYLALSSPGSRVITLEGCTELSRIARGYFSRLGLGNTELIEGRFEDTLGEALKKLGSADLVYIDGNHRKEALLDYFDRCVNYIHNNSVIVCDDIHASKEMEEAWELILQKPEVTVSLDFFYSGWVFFRKESSRQHFRLRYI